MTENNIFPGQDRLGSLLERAHQKNPALDKNSLIISLTVAEYAARVGRLLNEHFASFGLSQGRFVILMTLYLYEEEDITAQSFVEGQGVSKATISSLIKKLQAEGLVTRVQCQQDKRRQFIKITKGGKKVMAKVMPEHQARIKEAFADVSLKEFQRFEETFQLLLKSFMRI